MEYSSKMAMFNNLCEEYTAELTGILDFSVKKNLLPMKLYICIDIIKKYIRENSINLIEYSVKNLLPNKELILNFSLDGLDELELDSEDNISRKYCISGIEKVKQNINSNNNLNIGIFNEGESSILNLIIEIKNKGKKLNYSDKKQIKRNIEKLINVLENMSKIFI